MFHRISDPDDPSILDRFKRFVVGLGQNHRFVSPGDRLSTGSLSVCLTFDDAYYDFYCAAFPFLQSWGIKSVLAVPTQYIIDDTHTKLEERLRPVEDRLRTGEPYDGTRLCTWRELVELHRSGLVDIASHGHSHRGLAGSADLETELAGSRELLETRLGSQVSAFVYPFGRFDSRAHGAAMSTYEYVMRIGNALNFNWGGRRRLLYRVNADPFWREGRRLGRLRLLGYGLNWLTNRARNR